MSDTALQETETLQNKPGRILREARERLGLEQKDIASQLNLQVDTIDAVENDAAEKLPAPTYVRGYIRSYARMVQLDSDALIKLYENEAAGPPEIIPDIKQHHQVSSTDKPVKAVTYLITFALALLLLAWLQSHYVVDKNNQVTETPVEESSDHFTSPSYPDSGIPAYEPPASGLSLYSENELIPRTEQDPSPLTDKLISEIEMPGAPDINAAISEATGTDDEENTSSFISTDDRVKFKITKDSWIEVYDSGNNKLYLGLAKSGEELDITGVAPFNVLLGYSPGVEVTFNGSKFDPEPFSNAGIAKFILSKPGEPEFTE